VLPSLGETSVVLSTVGRLVPGVQPTGTEPDDATAAKGRAGMARVVRRAVRDRQQERADQTRPPRP